MTTREKLAHLYRRFGFGTTPEELTENEKIGYDAALHRLLDYRNVNEKFNVYPYEFAWRSKGDADPSAGSYRVWWAMRMLCTFRPAQEQLTLFWHSHFAVSDGKVGDGSMMLQYLNTLRDLGDGKFVNLLKAVGKDPAMMKYLYLQRSLVGNPNENFAREVMELFTLGIGNYTEKDVKEAARAFTGWSFVNMFYEFPGPNLKRIQDAIAYNRPLSAFALMPAMHDKTPKTILGRTDFFDGDMFLEMLAMHPLTARHICTKLWTYYAYPDPEPAVIEGLTEEWQKSGGEIKHILFSLARRPEFFSDRCLRRKIKSPADLCVGMCRQLGIGPVLMALRGDATIETPMNPQVTANVSNLVNRMSRAGLSLFYPEDVSGWKGGTAWISPAQMVERYGFRGLMIYAQKGAGPAATNSLAFIRSRQPTTSLDVAHGVAEMFDIDLKPESSAVLGEMVDRLGGMKLLEKDTSWARLLDRMIFTLMAAPETHLC